MKMEPGFDLYSLELQPLPDPIFICLCAAPGMKEERETLRLSDAFGPNSRGKLELVVDVININYGRNQEFLDSCPALRDYSWFISRFRYHLKHGKSPEEAADAAIEEMANDSVIKPLLLANQAEVRRMCILEYDEEKTLNGRLETGIRIGREEGIVIGREEGIGIGREEGIGIGLEKGRAEERAKTFKMFGGLVADGLISIKEAAKRTGVSVAEFRRLTGR